MTLKAITDRINKRLAGEMYSYNELIPYLDDVIDDINAQLNTIYPAFSELPSGTTEYTCFPDRYIRNVVCLGAAFKFYVTDEEGISSANAYRDDYSANLFLMIRDYLASVPTEYKNVDTNGAYPTRFTGVQDSNGEGVLGIDFNNVRI
jgi:hypothetical protein